MKFLLVNPGRRPDFRLVIAFLWSDLHDVDTDGDAREPTAMDWTELECRERHPPLEEFEIEPVNHAPLVLAVSSKSPFVAARVAGFLAEQTGAEVREGSMTGPVRSMADLEGMMGADFSLEAARERVRSSVWQQATPDNPYPGSSD